MSASAQTPSLQLNGHTHQRADQTQWNGVSASGAVQAQNGAVLTEQQLGGNAVGIDAIREGKQKARETMAAAIINPDTPSAQARRANGEAQPNGGPQLSRKRSRDGTQLPMNQGQSSVDAANGSTPSHDDILLDRYMQRDMLHGAVMNEQEERSRELIGAKEMEKEFYLHEVRPRRLADPGSIFGYGFMGYGNGITNELRPIAYTSMRGAPKGRRCKELRISRKDNAQQAELHEELVPVRLDIELDKLRLRDTFTWNLHEKLISPDMFVDYLLEDLKLPPDAVPELTRQVRAEMQEQVGNYYPHIVVEDGPLEPGRPYSDHKDDEMRIQIKLNITIGRITLIDQFEWDVNNPLNSPEEFARQMALENALSGEFTTAIAHSIREQGQLYTKSLYLTNHCFDGRLVKDPELKDGFMPTLSHTAFRPQQMQKDWTPYMYEMSEAELERIETSLMREHRAQKRQLNRRGGPALPDLKDRQRTMRSLLVHTVVPGAVEYFEQTGILKTRRGGRGGRRGAARTDGDVDTDELDSEDSSAESPAPSALNAGTARTRGMRGAASAAQAAMRANYGRSATPDAMLAAPPAEQRALARRSLLREGSVLDEDDQLVVRLKIGKAKFKHWWDEYRARKRASEYPLSGYATQPMLNTPQSKAALGSPSRAPSSSLLQSRTAPQPRTTPLPNGGSQRKTATAAAAAATPSTATTATDYDAQGGVAMTHWPLPSSQPPPPPPWLLSSISLLRSRHPTALFEPLMRPYALDVLTQKPTRTLPNPLDPGAPAPEGCELRWLPKIRCLDCPAKSYTALLGSVVEDFEVHLRNRKHREGVEGRLAREG